MFAYIAGLGIPLYLIGIAVLGLVVVLWMAVGVLDKWAENGVDVNVNVTVGFEP